MQNFDYERFSLNSYLTCYIEDGVIFSVDYQGNKKQIGVDNATIEEAISKAEEYHDKLVELGVITKPKTQEEINAELLETIKALQSEIKTIKEDKKHEPKRNSKDVGNKSNNSKSSNANGE